MGLKLRLLSFWTPEWFQKRGLGELCYYTVKGLQEVLLKKTSQFDNSPSTSNVILKGTLDERRRHMAEIHNELVATLINTMGRDEAFSLGREAMFTAGLSLGQEFRSVLGVGNSLEDLILAAKILYKVLGIEFNIKKSEEGGRVMVVNHCTLAKYYTSETCIVLSAADEGVVQGLNPKIIMKFTERITHGSPCCLASIRLEGITK